MEKTKIFVATGMSQGAHVCFLKLALEEERCRKSMENPSNIEIMMPGTIRLDEIEIEGSRDEVMNNGRIFIAYKEDRVHNSGLLACKLFLNRKEAREYASANQMALTDYMVMWMSM